MKRKMANAQNHKSIIKSKYINKFIKAGEFKGNISLIKIEEVKNEWYVIRKSGIEECILAPKYKWLEIYPDNENYAITAMYDENNNIIEWYFDVIKGSGVIDKVPYIDDLYLDVVLTHSKEIVVLDESELEEALQKEDITKEEFDLAKKVGAELVKKVEDPNSFEVLKDFSDKYLYKLMEEMNCL